MSLKVKLLSAFLTIILLPMILISVACSAIIRYQVNSIQEDYGIYSDSVSIIANPIQLLNRATRGVYNEISLTALRTPDKFIDTQFLRGLDDRLKEDYSFLIVRRDGHYIYCEDWQTLEYMKTVLPHFGVYNTEVDGGMYIAGEHPYLLKQKDFLFSDGKEGTVFILTDVNVLVPQIKWSFIQILVSFLCIIIITAVILILSIYRSIVSPLNKLRRATYELKDGNLEYEIKGVRDDEIGELCNDFNEMRIRLKELIDEKLENEKNTKELISNISHDLKTPITAIKGYTEGILDGVADTEEKKERYLRTIYKKASDMTSLVEELSFYSKINANNMPYTFTSVSIAEYFDDCIEDCRLDIQSAGYELKYVSDVDYDVKVMVDCEQLKRVINNIITNSLKYMGHEHGEISIHLLDQNQQVEIQITDTGQGISKEALPFIFDRFYRADKSRNTRKGGSGLGLSIAKMVIENHGGRIGAESSEGVGTMIWFTLNKIEEKKNE